MAERQVMTITATSTRPADKTIEVDLNRVSYEIDLSGSTADQFGAELAPYLGAARRTPGSRGRTDRKNADRSAPALSAPRPQVKASKLTRGRVPTHIQEKYGAARLAGTNEFPGQAVWIATRS